LLITLVKGCLRLLSLFYPQFIISARLFQAHARLG
jgi:hypothetical protein